MMRKQKMMEMIQTV